MLNPADYLLPKLKTDCFETLRNELEKAEPLSLQEQCTQFTDQIEQTLLVSEQVDANEKNWALPPQVANALLARMLPLKSLMLKLVNTSDYGLFEEVIHIIREIARKYIILRRKFKSFKDEFLSALSELIIDVSKVSDGIGDVYFSRTIYSVTREIALDTLDTQVLGSKSGYNQLTRFFWDVLRDRARRAVSGFDRDRAYDATVNLGEVGKHLAIRGIGHSASEVGGELGDIAQLCAMTGDTVTPVAVRRYLAEIFYCLLWFGGLYPNCSLPYKRMIDLYEKMLGVPSMPSMSLSIRNWMFVWDPDISKDRSLNMLVYAALFPPHHTDKITDHNLNVVENICEFLEKVQDSNHYLASLFTDHAYQIGLWLLAFVDKEITLEMTRLQQCKVPTEEQKQKAASIFFGLMRYLTDTYFDSMENKRQYIVSGEILVSILSLLALTLYLNDTHNIDVKNKICEILVQFSNRLEALQETMDYTARQNIKTFCGYLGRRGEDEIGKKIWVSADAKSDKFGSISPLYYFHHVKRPIMTFDANLFAAFDAEIFRSSGESNG